MTCFLLAASFRPLQRRRFPLRSRSRKKKRKKIDFCRPFPARGGGGSSEPPEPTIATPLPTPESITDLRSFLGMVTQLSAFCSDIADCTHPLRGLLSTKNEFIWTVDHNAAFAATKQALVAPQALAYYDPSRPTRLHTDASRRRGLGFVLTQKQPDNTWRTVQAGSRFLSGA